VSPLWLDSARARSIASSASMQRELRGPSIAIITPAHSRREKLAALYECAEHFIISRDRPVPCVRCPRDAGGKILKASDAMTRNARCACALRANEPSGYGLLRRSTRLMRMSKCAVGQIACAPTHLSMTEQLANHSRAVLPENQQHAHE
jgi:hypothetical protein